VVSERLNSMAMVCFWDWVRVVSEGISHTARGLPVNFLVVKTSRVVKFRLAIFGDVLVVGCGVVVGCVVSRGCETRGGIEVRRAFRNVLT
jgi:hypothetical protein